MPLRGPQDFMRTHRFDVVDNHRVILFFDPIQSGKASTLRLVVVVWPIVGEIGGTNYKDVLIPTALGQV